MKHHDIPISAVTKCGYMIDAKKAWIELKVDDDNAIRIVFPEDFPPTLGLAVQQVQGHMADERRAKGLPVLETSYVAKVKQLEFGCDDVNQVAVIRTRFENGASQDTPLSPKQISDTIQFLQTSLDHFENLDKSKKH